MKLYPLMITLGLSLLGLTGKSHADELKIYVIKPNTRINWSSPSMLSITSGLDSAGSDYAPIGHFAVEVKCSLPNHLEINHILTGMERVNKVESRKITLEQKLGLGSLIYTFKGALESAAESTSFKTGFHTDLIRTTVAIKIPLPAKVQVALTLRWNSLKSQPRWIRLLNGKSPLRFRIA